MQMEVESKAFNFKQRLEEAKYELQDFRLSKHSHTIDAPVFPNGASVIQWWASWMKDAKTPPAKYKGKKRPAWFNAEILTYEGFGSILYAGVFHEDVHIYHVY